MTAQGLHPVILIHSYLTFACAGLFFYQALVNYFLYKQNVLDRKLMLSHIGLCFFSGLYSLNLFVQVWQISWRFNLILLHVLWVSGSMITFFYIDTVKRFLRDESGNLRFIRYLPLFGASCAVIALFSDVVLGEPLFNDEQVPVIAYKNLFMQATGSFNPSVFVKVLSLNAVFPIVYSSAYFLWYIRRSPERNRLLAFGIILDFVVIVNDASISINDSTYGIPFMFIANIFEILRITSRNQIELGRRNQKISDDLIQTQKLAGAGNYFATLAHEVFNPLQAAQGYLELFLRRTPAGGLSPDQKRYIDSTTSQLRKIQLRLSTVKSFSRTSPDDVHAPCDLTSIVRDALDTLQLKLSHANIDLKHQHSSVKIRVSCIPDQLVQVFTNLVSNSIDALAGQPAAWISIREEMDHEGRAVVTVTDSGPGIEPEVQKRMWETRFTTKKNTGVGLGLSICKMILENHGGSIRYAEDVTNTTFIITLPVTTEEQV